MKILVLDVPSLHLGYVGCYGNDWVATPNLDRLASEAVVFDCHFFGGDLPPPPAWTGHHSFPGLARAERTRFPTLRQTLAERNLEFVFIEGGPVLSLESLQHVVAQTVAAGSEERSLTWARFPSLAPPWNLVDDLLDSYCEDEDQPWPSPPVGPLKNSDDLPRLQNTYAAVVTFVDAQLGVILESLRKQDLLDKFLVCLTSAKGLPLGEHGFIGFEPPWPYEEFAHLPLLMRLPHATGAGLRLNALTQPVDLFPTLLAHLGVAPSPSHGCDLWPLIRGEVGQVRSHAVSATAAAWALRTHEWAFLLPVSPWENAGRQPQLFVKPEDRWEVNDVRHHHLELAEELEKRLRESVS